MTIKADKQLTAAAGFADPRSYVAADGRECTYGDDWMERKKQLLARCGGRCEAELAIIGIPPERCTAEAADPHHIIRRSVKRDDRLANLLALCRWHHDLLDVRKPRWSRAGRP